MFNDNRPCIFKIIRKTAALVLLILISLSICSCDGISYQEVGLYTQRKAIELSEIFSENGMSFYQPNHTIEQYTEIKDYLTEDDVIIYYDKLGIDECNKILVVLGYDDFDDFLIKNNYVDEKGNPDEGKFRRETYERITNYMLNEK